MQTKTTMRYYLTSVRISSVQFRHSVVSDSSWPHGPQHTRPAYRSPAPEVYTNPCPLSRWSHPTISSSVILFSSCLQSFSASVSASVSVFPMNTQDWFPLGWTVWICLHSKGLSRIFFYPQFKKHQFYGAQLSLYANSHIHTWPQEKP